MRRIVFVVFLFVCFSLFSQTLDVFAIDSNVYYRGNDACKVNWNDVHIAYVKDLQDCKYLQYAFSNDGENFIIQTLDDSLLTAENALPTLERLPNDKIIIFYIKQVEENRVLMKTVSTDNGASFTNSEIASPVSEFSSAVKDGEIFLAYQTGSDLSFSYFQYFTDTEESENSDLEPDILKFWGQDELQGPVHSNSDIWIQNAGGGWPTFHSMVTTSGRFRVFPSGALAIEAAPMEDIFLGGYEEEVDEITFEPEATELHQNAMFIGYGQDIIYCKMDNGAIQTMYGTIVDTGIQNFDVYSWFPHNEQTASAVINNGMNWYEDADLLLQNQISVLDTVWVCGPTFQISPNGSAFYAPTAEIWIEGCVSGNLTIGGAENIYIVGDITYTHTTPGQPPDDPNNPNEYDYFGLVSEKKIFIKYKHKDPFDDFVIRDDNCDDVMLYGAYAAIGKGDTLLYGNSACHYDGLFTFEYQHPHGSTPSFEAMSPYTLTDTTYNFIDFHKFVFPISNNLPPNILGFNLHGNAPPPGFDTCGFPYEDPNYINSYPNNDPQNYAYPYGTDYPWYNPVWPESTDDIVFERGTAHLWGSVIQRRRGFMHRSGSDPYNHPPGNDEWDLENYHFGGTHPSTGYDKNYHHDSRFLDQSPIYFPRGTGNNYNSSLIVCKSTNGGENFDIISNQNMETTEYLVKLVVDGNLIAAVTMFGDYNFFNIHYSLDDGINFDSEYLDTLPFGDFSKVVAKDENLYFFWVNYVSTDYNYLGVFDPVNLIYNTIESFTPATDYSDFAISDHQEMVYAFMHDDVGSEIDLEFEYTDSGSSNFSNNHVWQLTFPTTILNTDNDEIFLNFNQQDHVTAIIKDNYGNDTLGNLMIVNGSLPNLTGIGEPEIPQITPAINSLSNFPNPFNPSTTISFNVTQSSDFATIEIYNLKGQKVKTLPVNPSTDQPINSVTWNGTDDNNKPVSSGIYFYKLKSGNLEKTKKMLLLK